MKRSRRGSYFAAAACALSLLLDCGRCAALPPDPPPADPAPRMREFTDLNGITRTIHRSAEKAGTQIVFFFDPQSPNSLLGLSFFDALCKRAGDFGLTVIAVEATGRPAAEVQTLLQRYLSVYRTPSFPVIADPGFAVAELFGRHRAPTSLFLGDRGEVLARRMVFDLDTAVEITRLVEQLLNRSEGDLSPVLRDVGLSDREEQQLRARVSQPGADERAGRKALVRGDRLPAFEFNDTTSRSGRWEWPGRAAIRVAFFWSASSPDAAAALAFFQGLYTRGGGGEYLEIIAVESTGQSPDAVISILKGFLSTQPAPTFPVVPDPQSRLVGIFGAGEPLPQTFLVSAQGDVLYRADGLDLYIQRRLEDKVGRAARIAGFGMSQLERDGSLGATTGGATEAPSLNRRREEEEALRFNLAQGDYFFTNGQYERAELFYQRYLALEPKYLHALVRLAQIYDRIREPLKARESWERVLRISPDHAEGRARLIQLRQTGLQ